MSETRDHAQPAPSSLPPTDEILSAIHEHGLARVVRNLERQQPDLFDALAEELRAAAGFLKHGLPVSMVMITRVTLPPRAPRASTVRYRPSTLSEAALRRGPRLAAEGR